MKKYDKAGVHIEFAELKSMVNEIVKQVLDNEIHAEETRDEIRNQKAWIDMTRIAFALVGLPLTTIGVMLSFYDTIAPYFLWQYQPGFGFIQIGGLCGAILGFLCLFMAYYKWK